MTHSFAELGSALADRYRMDREIGSGGMATVFLAHDIRHKREVALKILRPELGAVLGTERFLSEITVTAGLQHPNILPLFDSGEAAGLLYYVMPFVRGETLRTKMDRERQLAVDDAVRTAVALASALQYAHDHGVIHRDLKPENVLLQSGQPIIADFGIAIAVSNAGGTRVTQTGLSLGTPQYMSPEQATGDRVIDARSDIYSLGAVTYEMLSGEPPHSGASAQAIIAKLMTSDPQPLDTLRSTIPINVACAVEKALAKLSADRFSSAQEFAAALQNPAFTFPTRFLQTKGNAAEARKWKRLAGVAALSGLAITAAAVWMALKPEPAAPVVRYAIALDSGETLRGGLGVALSPDGQRFAYTVAPGAKVAVRERNRLEATIVPGTEQARFPFFSGDGKRIGYLVLPAQLRLVSLDGGAPVQISDSVIGISGASFGPDGKIYATGDRGRGIIRLTESPNAPFDRVTRVNPAEDEVAHMWPEVLPGGNRILFTITYGQQARGRSPAIAAADLPSGKYRVLVRGLRARYSECGHLLYVTADGTLMAAPFDAKSLKITGNATTLARGLLLAGPLRLADFALSRSGTIAYVTRAEVADNEAVWVTRDGTVQRVDSGWKARMTSPALSPDGKRLAVEIAGETGRHVWIKQLDEGPALKLTFEGTENTYPIWTPDGRHITYASNSGGSVDLWTKRADGSARAQRTLHHSLPLAAAVWSRDGQWLIARTAIAAEGNSDIFAMRRGVDSLPAPLLASTFSEVAPAISPDGRWLAYLSDETGRSEAYVVPFPNTSSAKWQISKDGAREPLWSRSGRELFFKTGSGLVAVSVESSPTFSVGRQRILFPVRDFTLNPNRQQYDISPDDTRFIFMRPVGGRSATSLIFIENWVEELKRK